MGTTKLQVIPTYYSGCIYLFTKLLRWVELFCNDQEMDFGQSNFCARSTFILQTWIIHHSLRSRHFHRHTILNLILGISSLILHTRFQYNINTNHIYLWTWDFLIISQMWFFNLTYFVLSLTFLRYDQNISDISIEYLRQSNLNMVSIPSQTLIK